MRYKKGDLPSSINGLLAFLDNELRKIEQAQRTTQPNYVLDTLHAPPLKTIEGMIALADGADWNPGSGGGVYCFRAGAWRFLG